MRFVAGRGAVAELLAESAMDKRMAALWQRVIGKMLLARAPWRGAGAERLQRGGAVAEMLAAAWRIAIGKKLLPGRAIGKKLLAGAPLLHHREAATGREVARHHREEIGKNLKSTRKPHTELLVDEGEEDSILFCNFGGKM